MNKKNQINALTNKLNNLKKNLLDEVNQIFEEIKEYTDEEAYQKLLLKINPSENKGTCTIKITESNSGNNYSISPTELEIAYENGNITSITPDKNASNFQVNKYKSDYVTSISLINDSRITDLTIQKTDKKGNACFQ